MKDTPCIIVAGIGPGSVSDITPAVIQAVKESDVIIGYKYYFQVSITDYENDIDMLRAADFACCPSNSLQAVKDFCSVHLCSNDEGCIADLINRIEKGLA